MTTRDEFDQILRTAVGGYADLPEAAIAEFHRRLIQTGTPVSEIATFVTDRALSRSRGELRLSPADVIGWARRRQFEREATSQRREARDVDRRAGDRPGGWRTRVPATGEGRRDALRLYARDPDLAVRLFPALVEPYSTATHLHRRYLDSRYARDALASLGRVETDDERDARLGFQAVYRLVYARDVPGGEKILRSSLPVVDEILATDDGARWVEIVERSYAEDVEQTRTLDEGRSADTRRIAERQRRAYCLAQAEGRYHAEVDYRGGRYRLDPRIGSGWTPAGGNDPVVSAKNLAD